jgi:hypothetical protein
MSIQNISVRGWLGRLSSISGTQATSLGSRAHPAFWYSCLQGLDVRFNIHLPIPATSACSVFLLAIVQYIPAWSVFLPPLLAQSYCSRQGALKAAGSIVGRMKMHVVENVPMHVLV